MGLRTGRGYNAEVKSATLTLVLATLSFGCDVSTLPSRPVKTPREVEHSERQGAAPSYVDNDAPEISRGIGDPGGVVILWSRSVTKDADPALRSLAESVRARLDSVARRTLGESATIDSRPEPQRVCPQSGCKAASIQLVVTRKGKGCAVVAVVSPPGRSSGTIVPLSGTVKLASTEVPFREPPENAITVSEFAKCEDVERALKEGPPLEGEEALQKALQAAAK